MRLRTPLALAAAGVLLLGACGGDAEPGETAAQSSPEATAGFPVTVGDLTLEEEPTAIVSLSAAGTEILFAIGAGDQVVAVDEHSTYPPEAPTTDLSGFTPNAEAIASYDPDLVVISYDPGDLVSQLNDILGIPVYIAADNPSTLEDIYQQIDEFGMLTGRTAEARDLVQQMSDDIAKIVADAPDRELTYYVEIDETPWAYTSQSIISNLFAMVGLDNVVVSDTPGEVSMQITPEYIVDADPDLIFLANAQYGMTAQMVADRDGWATIAAVRNGDVVELSPDIASRWGPRVVDLLVEVTDAAAQVS